MNDILIVIGWFLIMCCLALLIKELTTIVYFFKLIHQDNKEIIRALNELKETIEEEADNITLSN